MFVFCLLVFWFGCGFGLIACCFKLLASGIPILGVFLKKKEVAEISPKRSFKS